MRKRRIYTFIIASHADAKLRRLSIPYPVLIVMGFFALIGILTAGYAAYHYGRMLIKVSNYGHILSENDAFRSENHNYRIQTAQLAEKIDFLETTARRLISRSGMNSERGIGGVGGFSKNGSIEPSPASAGELPLIDKYNKNVTSLEERYRRLENYISDKALYEAAWPAFFPLNGYVTGGMGRREDPFTGRFTDYHTGVDISAPYGTKIIAPADGTVLFAGYRAGYGNIVVLDHKFGITTRYGHLSRFDVQVGQRVSRGDPIGYVGTSGKTTGPHLHFEMWIFNQPVNPRKYISYDRRG